MVLEFGLRNIRVHSCVFVVNLRSPIRDIRVIRGSPLRICANLRTSLKVFENFAPQFPEKEVKGCSVESTLNIVSEIRACHACHRKVSEQASAKAGGRLPLA